MNYSSFVKLRNIYANLTVKEIQTVIDNGQRNANGLPMSPSAALTQLTGFGLGSKCILCKEALYLQYEYGEEHNAFHKCDFCLWKFSNAYSIMDTHCANVNEQNIEEAQTVEDLYRFLQERIQLMDIVIQTYEHTQLNGKIFTNEDIEENNNVVR